LVGWSLVVGIGALSAAFCRGFNAPPLAVARHLTTGVSFQRILLHAYFFFSRRLVRCGSLLAPTCFPSIPECVSMPLCGAVFAVFVVAVAVFVVVVVVLLVVVVVVVVGVVVVVLWKTLEFPDALLASP